MTSMAVTANVLGDILACESWAQPQEYFVPIDVPCLPLSRDRSQCGPADRIRDSRRPPLY